MAAIVERAAPLFGEDRRQELSFATHAVSISKLAITLDQPISKSLLLPQFPP